MILSILKTKLFYIIILVLGLGMIIYSRQLQSDIKDYYEQYSFYSEPANGSFQLHDTYDSDHGSFSDFINSKNALTTEKAAYKMIQSPQIDYVEITENPFYYVGLYRNAAQDHSKHSMKNKKNGDEILTDFSGISLDKKAWRKMEMDNRIAEGKGFDDDSFDCDFEDTTPVIIGAGFRNNFYIGQKFSGNFILDRKKSYQVVGVMKAKQTYHPNDAFMKNNISLDHAIILPIVNISDKLSQDEKIILYSTKLEGRIYYKTNDDYTRSALYIDKIRKKTGFKYGKIYTIKDADCKMKLDI